MKPHTLAMLCACCAVCGIAVGQNEQPPPPGAIAPARPTAQDKPAPPPGQEPSLDELLGLPKTPHAKPEKGPLPPDQRQKELERQLTPGQAADEFKDAIRLMGDAAERLEAKDTSLGTQRIQSDVLLKLDKMIAEARKQRSQSKSKPQSQGQQDQQQQQQAKSQQSQAAGATGENRGEGPARTPEQLRGALPGATSSWGGLPPHVRDALLQGWADKFSSIYQGATEEYYKRLAEQPRPPGAPPR